MTSPTVSHVLFNSALMLQNERTNQTLVEKLGAAIHTRCHQPEEEDAFHEPVEWQRMEEVMPEVFDEAE